MTKPSIFRYEGHNYLVPFLIISLSLIHISTHVEEVIDMVREVNPDAVMVIKSTIPVVYTRSLYLKYAKKGVKKVNLLFSPEFAEENEAIRKVTDVEKMKEMCIRDRPRSA